MAAPLLLYSLVVRWGMKQSFTVVEQAWWEVGGWGRVPTCDSAHSLWLYSTASLGHKATMTCYPTQSHYPDTEPTSPCPILIMPSAWLGSDKYQFKSNWFDLTKIRKHEVRIRTRDLRIPRSLRREIRCSYSFDHPNCSWRQCALTVT